jgi:hypothetical protein
MTAQNSGRPAPPGPAAKTYTPLTSIDRIPDFRAVVLTFRHFCVRGLWSELTEHALFGPYGLCTCTWCRWAVGRCPSSTP